MVAGGGQSSLIGSLAPSFSGKLLDRDETFRSADHSGQVVVIDFLTSGYGAPAADFAEQKQLVEKSKNNNDLVFIVVGLDEDADALRKLMKDQGLEFPVVYESREASYDIARQFGTFGVPGALVIGRDGRFAAAGLRGPQLLSAVEAALKAPLDPAVSTEKASRLTINLALDAKESGLPGATIAIKAIGPDGKVVRETIRAPGAAKQFTWLYPPLPAGSEFEVKVEAEGLAPQERVVLEPGPTAEVSFLFTSPRAITGRVLLDDGATPVPNVKVMASRLDGLMRQATTGADGSFKMTALPGSYYVRFEGTDAFAPTASTPETFEVKADEDPAPVALVACRSVTVTGTVTDDEGATVAGADVRIATSSRAVKTDDAGHFELPGVPSKGKVQLYAMQQPKYASIVLEDFDGLEPQQLVLGQQAGSGRGLTAGAKVPPLEIRSLADGTPSAWQPPEERDTLVVFCALWHPQTPDLLERATSWAERHQANLQAVSIDWSLGQARREAEALSQFAANKIHFGGPGGLAIGKDWHLTSLGQAYLVSPEGRIRKSLPPGELP
jgi:hypothetical protein